ncbi:MAG: tetratricopeptide repeat protein [Verrucomicrobiota bacterium]
MTTHQDPGHENRFVRSILPWLVAAVAMAVYLLTLNRWISFSGLPYVARATGLMWMPELTGPYGSMGPFTPLLFLLTYPVRWLPVGMIPIALNVMSAVFSSITLGLLARTVALLPHDRTHEQRQREHSPFCLLTIPNAWIAPVLAVCLCGLQLMFWENATSIAGDSLNLMLLAYAVRCLMEFRLDERESWLYRAAFVYAAGMTGDWMMVGLLPGFVGAVIWIHGMRAFHLRFIWRFLVCGLIGLLFYLVLPLAALRANTGLGFFQSVLANLQGEKELLHILWKYFPNYLLLMLATVSVLPLLLIGIRWASYFGDPSKLGIALTTAVLHLAHFTLFGICIWIAFDPMFSPMVKGMVLPGLYPCLFYFGALAVGYFTGYFLLVFIPILNRMGYAPGWQFALYRLAIVGIWALLLVVPAGLVVKNLPQILVTNGPAVKHYAKLLTSNLPEKAVLLADSDFTRADQPSRLWLAQQYLAQQGRAEGYIFVDTAVLSVPQYQAYLQQRYGSQWPPLPNRQLRIADMVNQLLVLSTNRPLVYLHPSFGYFFEAFYPQPNGLNLPLLTYPTNTIEVPPTPGAVIEANNRFWKETLPDLLPLTSFIQADPGEGFNIKQWLLQQLKIPFQPNFTAVTLGKYYSLALNFWGVQLQRNGQLKDANADFVAAHDFNPDNVAAINNLQCNTNLLAGNVIGMDTTPSGDESVGKYRNWQQAVRETGPFDDPRHCYEQALVYTKANYLRQAVQQLHRIVELAPDYIPAQFWLARFYAQQNPAKAITMVREIRKHPESLEANGIRPLELLQTEVFALYCQNKPDQAEQIMQAAMEKDPKNKDLIGIVVQMSFRFGRYTNALMGVENGLKLAPDDVTALSAAGFLNIQLGNYAKAIPYLNKAIELENNNYSARFNRALAYLQIDNLKDAKQDYEEVLRYAPNAFAAYYGLGEIAWRQKDTNAAIHNYELYLTNAPPGTAEAKSVVDRLESLQPKSP